MPYSPPSHSAVDINFSGVYSPPSHASANFPFGAIPTPPPPGSSTLPWAIVRARLDVDDWFLPGARMFVFVGSAPAPSIVPWLRPQMPAVEPDAVVWAYRIRSPRFAVPYDDDDIVVTMLF